MSTGSSVHLLFTHCSLSHEEHTDTVVQDITAFRCQENLSNYTLLNRTWRLTTVFKKASQKNLSLSISTSLCAVWYPFHNIFFSVQVSQVVSSSESFKPKCMCIYFFHEVLPIPLIQIQYFALFPCQTFFNSVVHKTFFSHKFLFSNDRYIDYHWLMRPIKTEY